MKTNDCDPGEDVIGLVNTAFLPRYHRQHQLHGVVAAASEQVSGTNFNLKLMVLNETRE